ncbi:MAG: hypothetical protein M1836_006080 [Candelina mexicana]|nr:MAG: hypothetical protein M1836_006080 [Candelina mexicana]
MYMTQTVPSLFPTEPVAKAVQSAKGGSFTAATFHLVDDQPSSLSREKVGDFRSTSGQKWSIKSDGERSSPKRQKGSSFAGMNGYIPSTASASTSPTAAGMFVRALYDYTADDKTSLSFHQGDVIQVITQLESGWWDGVINGVRGWFPSNYCQLVTLTEDGFREGRQSRENSDAGIEEEDYEEQEYDEELDSNGNPRESPGLPMEGTENVVDEASYWIPQATPDGRLFYFNTMTGKSMEELPFDAPTSGFEQGPRDRTNISVPDQTRPPIELMARGFERNHEYDRDDGNSASEREGEALMPAPRGSLPKKRRSHISDGVSPATSIDSINGMSPVARLRQDPQDFYNTNISMSAVQQTAASIPAVGTTTSFSANPPGPHLTGTVPRSFFEDGNAVPLTWDRLMENMRIAVERYRMAIDNGDRSEYVGKAEDISDHLRLLLAAGSGTTDNHSGNPSIISTNKALYPHFRDMMSKFSKLVLSSHIAAADWPAQGSYDKCLQEADGVLHGVYGYVEVARQQRGEDIPRLAPGFVIGSSSGGSWRNNGLGSQNPISSSSFIDQDEYEAFAEPPAQLDTRLLQRMDELKKMVLSSIRRLDEQLTLHEKIVTPYRHEAIGDAVCSAAGKVIENYKPWISSVESINLAPLGSSFHNPQLLEFACQKQSLYDLASDLVIGCQSVTAPLGDEWSELRGDSLEDRLNSVRLVCKQVETSTMQLGFSLQLLLEMMPQQGPSLQEREYRRTDGGASYQNTQQSAEVRRSERPQLADAGRSLTFSDGIDPTPQPYQNGDNSKLKWILGVEPAPPMPSRESEDKPPFLQLEHEKEISYDKKSNPPQLRGGTLTALVEQLTRHDRLDSDFNNTFLLTYRSFTTASELFELLVKRFSIQPPSGMANEEFQTWVDLKQKPIRMRVVNILKGWFDNYWMEGNDEASKQLIRRVQSFAKDSVATTSTPGSGSLMTAVEQRLRGQETNAKRLVLTLNTNTPTPIMPKNMKKLKFLDIDATEFARQLTIIESRLYAKIKPTECLNKTWQKKVLEGQAEPAPNVKALILHSNQLTNWVAEMILTQQDVKKRVVVIKHFVTVADRCRSLNNFSTLTSIISALGTAPIHRLKRTWDQLGSRTTNVLDSMRRLMASTKNFMEYRETLQTVNPPCIPFFGVYLTDLTFIEDGIPSLIKKTDLINFAKRAKTAEVIRNIQQYQNVPYPLQPVPELQDYILSNMQAAGDVHEMYDKSLAVEPREREDEKIARYARYQALFLESMGVAEVGAVSA